MFLSLNHCRRRVRHNYILISFSYPFISIIFSGLILNRYIKYSWWEWILFLLFSAHHKTVALSRLNRKDIHNISLTCRGQLFNCHNWHPLCCGHWSVREVSRSCVQFWIDSNLSIHCIKWILQMDTAFSCFPVQLFRLHFRQEETKNCTSDPELGVAWIVCEVENVLF